MIGRALVRLLYARGHSVRAHGRKREVLEALFSELHTGTPLASVTAGGGAAGGGSPPRLEIVESDFSVLNEIDAELLCKDCSAILHTAALVHRAEADAKEYDSLNVRATELLARAARKSGLSKFIFFSSSSVYGNRATRMVAEASDLHPDTPYAASKIASEKYLQENPAAASTIIVRPSLVFGPGDRGNMLSLIRQVLSGKYFLIGDGAAEKSLIYADDLAEIIALLLEKDLPGFHVFNAAYENPVSVRELSEAILMADGRSSALFCVPENIVSAAAQLANALFGKRSPLSPERLDKLTRDNSISLTKLKSISVDLKPKMGLMESLREELNWARRESIIK